MDMHSLAADALLMAKSRKKAGGRGGPKVQKPIPPSDDDDDLRRVYPPLPWKLWWKECGVKQYEVAEAIGIDETSLSLIASGQRPYKRAHLDDIAKFLGLDDPALLLHPPMAKSLSRIIGRLSPEQRELAANVLLAMNPKK